MENYKSYLFIVFCPDHFNPLGLIRNIGDDGIKPIVIIYGKNKPHIITSSIYPSVTFWVKSMEEGLNILKDRYSGQDRKSFLYTCSDDIESFLDLHYDELKDDFYFFNGGAKGQITKEMDKLLMDEIAERCGFRIPKTEVVSIGDLPKVVSYPLMTKSTISTIPDWKANVHICHNEKELRKAYNEIHGESKVILQEYIEKKNELDFEGISLNYGKEVYIPIQVSYLRFENYRYGNYIKYEKFKEEALKDKITKLMKEFHFTGMFEMEFLVDKKGELYFLEVNFRNSPWTYPCPPQGINLPIIFARSILSGHIDTNGTPLRKEVFTAMDECADFKEAVLGRKVGFFKWYKQMRSCDTLFYSKKGDMKPLYAFILHRILSAIKDFFKTIRH